jgi:hypothetical protein
VTATMDTTPDATTAETAGGEVANVQEARRTVNQIRDAVRVRQRRRAQAGTSWPPELVADLWRLPEARPFLAKGTVKAIYTFLQQMEREPARHRPDDRAESERSVGDPARPAGPGGGGTGPNRGRVVSPAGCVRLGPRPW